MPPERDFSDDEVSAVFHFFIDTAPVSKSTKQFQVSIFSRHQFFILNDFSGPSIFQKVIKLFQIFFFVKLKRTGQPANRLSQPNKLIELIMIS